LKIKDTVGQYVEIKSQEGERMNIKAQRRWRDESQKTSQRSNQIKTIDMHTISWIDWEYHNPHQLSMVTFQTNLRLVKKCRKGTVT
jgi:accessory colonization factor AcfC